jgi:hypothetical protein
MGKLFDEQPAHHRYFLPGLQQGHSGNDRFQLQVKLDLDG